MDVGKYAVAKASGKVTLQRYGQSFQCIKRQYDAETGVEVAPVIATFTEEELLRQKTAVEETLASIIAMLSDIAVLKQGG